MRIAILAFDGISPFMLSTPLTIFGEPFLALGHRVTVCAAGGAARSQDGLVITTPHDLAEARAADVVILPGWRDAAEPVPAAIADPLADAVARGGVAVGLCLGAFGLAQTGLLDGLRATTHWVAADRLARDHPRVTVDPGAIFVDQGAMLTSAGIAAGLDCCLHLLARLSGQAEANRVARHLVVAPQRSGAEPQLLDRPAPVSSADEKVAALLERLRADPTAQPVLDDLARQLGLSRRSLTRHIRARTGGNLGGWMRRARLARAQQILTEGSGMEQVAARAGFPDAPAMRAAFRAELGLTPRQWLQRQRLG